MITSVSLQYAKALFDLGKEKQLEDIYYADLKMVCEALNENNKIWKVLSNPLINLEERKNILKNIFQNSVHEEFLHFLFVLVDNFRLEEITDIFDCYEYYLNQSNNVCNAIVFSKYEMLEEEKKNLIKALEKRFNKKINLKYQLDENLLGGIIVDIDGKVIDASALNQIVNLKNELKKGW